MGRPVGGLVQRRAPAGVETPDRAASERHQFEVLAATPAVEAKDLDIQITPDAMLIKADILHKHAPEEGSVEVCEFTEGQLFRSIHFPEKVDPDSATAEYRNGMLRITASIAKPVAQKKVEIAAA
jgi:HSP20 family protein